MGSSQKFTNTLSATPLFEMIWNGQDSIIFKVVDRDQVMMPVFEHNDEIARFAIHPTLNKDTIITIEQANAKLIAEVYFYQPYRFNEIHFDFSKVPTPQFNKYLKEGIYLTQIQLGNYTHQLHRAVVIPDKNKKASIPYSLVYNTTQMEKVILTASNKKNTSTIQFRGVWNPATGKVELTCFNSIFNDYYCNGALGEITISQKEKSVE